MKLKSVAMVMGLVAASSGAWATWEMNDAINSDRVLPNSPWKENGIPDSGTFNPTGGPTVIPAPPVVPPPPPPPPPVVVPPPPPPPPPPPVAPPPPPPLPPPPPPLPPRPDRN